MAKPERTVKAAWTVIWRVALSMVLSAAVLWLLFRMVDDSTDSARRVLAMVRDASVLGVGVYLATTLAQTLLRAIRYRLLIAAAPAQPPPLPPLTLITMARNMFVDLLPARLGELLYVGMLNRGCGVSGAACFSSMSVSILFDLGALTLVLGGALTARWAGGHRDLWLIPALVGTVVIVGVGAVALFRGVEWAVHLLRRVPLPGAAARLRDRLADALQSLASALARTREGGVMGRILALSFLIRILKYTGLVALFLAVAAPLTAFRDAGVPSILMGLISAEGTASLPLPAFMSFGTYEAGGAAVWTLLGLSAADAMRVMLALHIWSQMIDYSIGLLASVVFLLTVRRTRLPGRPSWLAWWSVAVVVALLLAGVAGFAIHQRIELKRGTAEPPPAGESVQPAVVPPLPSPTNHPLAGFILWSSNRGGNHDIWRMDLPGREIRPLTSHPHTEYFPRISPDGARVAFCRSQIPWVSQRNHTPWDAYLLDLATGAETFVASNANTAVWSADGKHLIFQRNGTQCIEHTLATGAERTLAQLGPTTMLFTPSWSDARQSLAVTLRKAQRATGLLTPDGQFRKSGNGCQLVWAPDASFLVYVDDGGRQKNAFYQLDPDTLTRTLLLDLPGEFSHEYFPALSQDSRWLVFAASTGGHEHDTADYEVFLWERGAPPESAVRLTFHTGNDCWPDIHLTRP